MKLRIRKWPVLLIAGTFTVLFLCKNLIVDEYIINSSDSLPHYLYKGTHSLTDLSNQTYVLVCLRRNKSKTAYDLLSKLHPELFSHKSVCPAEVMPLIKRIAAKPHDQLVASGNHEIIVNSYELRGTAPHQTLQTFRFTGEVPDDRYLIYTPHPDSLDSRYFGFITKDEIIDTLTPVF